MICANSVFPYLWVVLVHREQVRVKNVNPRTNTGTDPVTGLGPLLPTYCTAPTCPPTPLSLVLTHAQRKSSLEGTVSLL